MRRTSLFLDTEQIEQLQQLSEATNLPTAEHVRRAIDLYLLFVAGGNGDMAEVVADAQSTFPDAATPDQALRRALFRWHYDRLENSNRQALNRIESAIAEILERLKNDHDTE